MRILTVFFAYVCAALAGVILMFLLSVIYGNGGSISGLSDLRSVGFLVLIAATIALPIAIPVIIATELLRTGDWRIFVGAGALLGILLTVIATRFFGPALQFGATFIPISILAAYVYWLVAWRWMSPPRKGANFGEMPG